MNLLKNNKLLRQWGKLSLPVRTSIAIMAASFFQSGMKLLFVPIFTRIMSTGEYGTITVYEAVESTLATLTMLSLNASVYSRGMQEFKQDRDRYTTSLLLLSNLCTLAVAVVFLLFGNPLSEMLKLSKPLLTIMFVVFLFMPAYNFYIARAKFEYKYQGMLLLTIVLSILAPVVAMVCVLTLGGDKALIKIAASEAVLLAAYLVLYVTTFRKSKWKISRNYVKYALAFNIPLVPHYASQHILASCDRIMISAMIDKASAGIYGLSYQVSSVVRLVWTSINAVLVPWEYDKIEKGKVEDIRRTTRLLILVYGLVCIGIMFVAPEVVRFFAPSDYHAGIYLMPPVIAGVFFSGLYSLLAILEFYYKKNVYVMFASLIAAIANIILNWIFIPMFGYTAAAYTTLFCYMLYAFLHAMNLKRLKLDHYYDMKAILLLSAAVTAVSLAAAKTYDHILIRYGLIAVLLLAALRSRKMIISTLLSIKKKK